MNGGKLPDRAYYQVENEGERGSNRSLLKRERQLSQTP
jgi:hypothetical protein